ncbi:hypothetical protein ACUN7V_06180 [Quadrisphaera oryzae]|uniref:hypothetical protein n=1 Tax=Quadrisphaera TaxID=317661 RepID=UPI001646FD92|nr:hypothetical protein [Quadrisphaera sp. RL12-1S]MBC3761601.1 hypothetical protein [Quadrisphaera sp. RL12-1S]
MTSAPRERAERELGRVLTRLAALGPTRLSRPADGGGPSPADAVRPVLQELADEAASAEGRVPVVVPVLEDRALGDQVAVLGRDLLDVGDAAALERAAHRLEALRRSL